MPFDPISRRRRRNQYQVAAMLAVALATGFVIALPSLMAGRGVDRVRTTAAAKTTTTLAPTTTTAPDDTSTTEVPVAPPDTTPPADSPVAAAQPPPPSPAPAPSTTPVTSRTPPRPVPRPTTTTTIACQNSSDARCGAFRWSPAPPANQAMSVQVTYSPAHPAAGQTVVFHVVVHDPDGHVDRPAGSCGYSVHFGDEASPQTCTDPPHCPAAYGPWSPPGPAADGFTIDYAHVYGSAGNFSAHFEFNVDSGCQTDPYRSRSSDDVVVTVSP